MKKIGNKIIIGISGNKGISRNKGINGIKGVIGTKGVKRIKEIMGILKNLRAIPTYSNLFQPVPNYSNLFQSNPTYSKLFQTIPPYSNLFPIIPIFVIIFLFPILSFGQSLDSLQSLATHSNPMVQSKYKEFEASLQKIPQVGTLMDPTLSFGYFISPVETRVGPQRTRISLSQMFPWFGTLKARKDAAALMAESKFQEFQDVNNLLRYQVAAAYFPLYELKIQQSIEKKNIEILEAYKNISQKKFENGQASLADVLRADLSLKSAETNLGILTMKHAPLLAEINKLLNRASTDSISFSDSLTLPDLETNYRRDSLLADNPMLKKLDLKIQAGEAQEVAARKQGLPNIGLGFDYVFVGKREDMNVPDNGKNVIMPMVSVSLPIYRKKYSAAVKEAQLMQETWALQKEDSENALMAGYETAWFELQRQASLITLYDQQIQESQQVLNLLFSAYSNSGKDFEEVLRMQQQVLQYERMKALAQKEYQVAKARIDYLTANN